MLLVNVKNDKKGTYIEVQNGSKSYRSRALNLTETEFYLRDVVLGMISSAALENPILNLVIPDAKEIKGNLKDGIGLSDNHKQLIMLKDGKTEILDEGPRFLIAGELQRRVGHALVNKTYMKGVY